jgi:hypothetical protein
MAIDMDQNYHVPQLRPTYFTALKSMKNEESASSSGAHS